MLIAARSIYLSPWEWSSSDWAGLTFVVLVIALLVAWRQVSEARRLRKDQARPFVVIEFHPWSTIIELKITNIGTTLARDVTFEFDPPLASTHDSEHIRGPVRDLNMFKKGIPSLAPAREIKLFFDQFPSRVEQKLPMTYDVTVSYKDNSGESYTDKTVLDLEMYLGTGGITRHTIHDVHKRLEELVREIKRWTAFGGGIKTMSATEIEEYNRREEERYAELEAAAQAQAEAQAPTTAEAAETEPPDLPAPSESPPQETGSTHG